MKRSLIIIFLFWASNILFAQWIPQISGTANQLDHIYFTDAANGFICGASSTILRTTNSGTNWSAQPNSTGVNLWGIVFINSTTGIVIGDDAIARTTNAGVNWVNITPPLSGQFRGLAFPDQNTGYIAGSGGSLMRSTNSGANWTALSAGITEVFADAGFANASTGFVVGLNGTVIKTTNSGDNWTVLQSGLASNLFSISVINTDTSYIAGDLGKVLKTTNGGTNWIIQPSGTTALLRGIHFTNANTGTAVGSNNIIIRTTNGGANWIAQNSGLTGVDFITTYFISLTTGYAAGTDGKIIYTTTGGFSLPAAPNLVAPVNGAVNVPLTPLLDWDSLAAAKTYDLQLGTDSVFNSPLIDTTLLNFSQLQISAGRLQNNVRYYWRVRGVNIVGNGPWSSIFHFTTVAAIPNAPILLLPINNAANVSLNPFFDWDSTSPALYYRLQVSSDSLFSGAPEVDITNILFSSYTLSSPSLQSNTRYYWRVATTNGAGTGPWSNVFRFTTIITVPQAPILVSPPNNSNNIPLTPTLDWRDDITATSYQVQLSTDSTFGTVLLDTGGFNISQLTVRSGLLVNLVRYYWRVRTTNNLGTGPWALPWNFRTGLTPPAAPILRAPPNGAVDISTIVTLDWDDVPFADTYRVQISEDSLFGTILINAAPINVSQYTTPGGVLQNNTLYYWRVSATNSSGTGPFSAVWHFRTVISAPIAAPDLLSPPNGSTITNFSPLLDWNDVSGSTGYKVQLAIDSLFISPLIDSNVTASQLTVPNGLLIGSTIYYWRARARNAGGYGPWSVIWHFTTSPIGIILISTVIPKEYKLYNNYPNPFNPSTRIRFDIPNPSDVKIVIYDLMGREQTTLIRLSLPAGTFETQWSPLNAASGVYFYRMEAGNYIKTGKMLLIK